MNYEKHAAKVVHKDGGRYRLETFDGQIIQLEMASKEDITVGETYVIELNIKRANGTRVIFGAVFRVNAIHGICIHDSSYEKYGPLQVYPQDIVACYRVSPVQSQSS